MKRDQEDRILTTPEEIHGHVAHLPTGNDFVSLPTVGPRDGAVERLGVLHLGCASLLELCGPAPASKQPGSPPLLAPLLRLAGEEQPLCGADPGSRLSHWIPCWRWSTPGGEVTLEGILCAPPGHKGLVYLLRARAAVEGPPRRIDLGWRGQWGDTLQTVFSAGRVHAVHRVRRDRWTAGPVFEVRAGPALLGWALAASAPLDRCCWCGPDGSPGTEELTLPAGVPISYELSRSLVLAPGATAELALYCGVNREGDGARTVAVDLARRGGERLLAETLGWLDRRAIDLPRLPEPERPRLEAIASRNLFFNRFFALGRCIDTEELAPVTSRSPLYYVSAAFWARDTLLWSLPGLLLADPAAARELLCHCFTRYLHNAGVHALYLDGTVLYPGFELDELCAFVIGLNGYLAHTGDASLLAEDPVARGLGSLEERLLARRHAEVWLFETFLCPSDDPALHPYLTYDNALVARTLELLADWEERGLVRLGPPPGGLPRREQAARVRTAILDHLVTEGPCGPMFAWSTDLGQPPRQEIYDEPPGSLQLLPYYGLCPADDPIYLGTRRWIRSTHNPYWYGEAPLGEAGCPHAEHPFVMSLFNALLSGSEAAARAILLEAPLDGGLACESFDRETGEVRTGAAFATCAGFLAYALHHAFGDRSPHP